jgi:hypothetical protein
MNSDSLDQLLFWEHRDWRKIDDSSLQARLCVSLQCTTKYIQSHNVYEDDIETITNTFSRLYLRGIVNPGEGVGAVGSSSIGEPSTQMTLNIFHYSGIAEKNVTLTGLPRFKQIINAVDTYDTSNMKIHLLNNALGSNLDACKFNARKISSHLVNTSLSQIVSSSSVFPITHTSLDIQLALLIGKTYNLNLKHKSANKIVNDRVSSIIGPKSKGAEKRLSNYVAVFVLDKFAMTSRHLTINDIGISLKTFMGGDAIVSWSEVWQDDWKVVIHPPTWSLDESFDNLVTEAVHDAIIQNVRVNGIESIKKAVPIQSDGSWTIETEGSDIFEIAQLTEVDVLKTCTNNIQETVRIFGVEAACCLMQSELHRVLSFDGSYVDPRHTWLLSDTVARSGCINPLNRHKMEELGGSLLQCASFEQTLEVFEHGAAFGKDDQLGGATEKLIVGQPVHVGTGSFSILENIPENLPKSTFVAPLFTNTSDTNTFVSPLQSFMQFEDKIVKKLKAKVQKPVFQPLPNLQSVPVDKNVSIHIIPLLLLMRKKAQTREPIWINANVQTMDNSPISKQEFAELEDYLETYTGWLHLNSGNHFTQFTEVEYDVGLQHLITRIEYSTKDVKKIHRTKTIEKEIHITNFADPLDAWKVNLQAISWTDIESDKLPTHVNPTIINIIHEKLFEKGPWAFRLTRTWSSNDIISAEQKQRGGSETCTFGISIELLKPWDLIEERASTDESISGAFIQRILTCLEIMN